MLELIQCSVAIGGATIVREASFVLNGGDSFGLVGHNGAGKTTLMRAIMGLAPLAAGTIQFEGVDLSNAAPHARAGLGIGYLPEDRRLIPQLSVEENMLLPAWAAQSADMTNRLKSVYEMIPELIPMRQRKALTLSGGQQKLVALGRALMVGTNLLLLDEPFEGVAPALVERLVDVVNRLRSTGVSIIFSESDLHYSAELASHIHRMDRGTLKEEFLSPSPTCSV